MGCDMCGAEEDLFVTRVEETNLSVCARCTKHGKVLRRVAPKPVVKIKSTRRQPELLQMLVDNYAAVIRNKRDKLGLKQEELARKLNEKTSVIHNVENGEFEPSIALARKFEKFLKVKLVEEYKDEPVTLKEDKSQGFTLGDYIKIKNG